MILQQIFSSFQILDLDLGLLLLNVVLKKLFPEVASHLVHSEVENISSVLPEKLKFMVSSLKPPLVIWIFFNEFKLVALF